MRKQLNFCGSTLKKLKAEANSEAFDFLRNWKRKLFHKTYGRDVKAETVKFLWKRKHFEERSWKQKQTWKRLTLYGAGSEKYSTAFIPGCKLLVCSLIQNAKNGIGS